MEDDILIDNYLKGILSKDEEKLFLERIESDSEFKEKFQLEERLFNALNDDSWSFVENNDSEFDDYVILLKEDDLQNLKKTIAKTSSEYSTKKSKSAGRIYYYLAAASVVLFLGFQFFFNQNISNQDLYDDYVALNDLPSFVSRGYETESLVQAENLFVEKKYEEALSIFQSLLNKSDDKANIYLYKGLAEIELEQYNAAEYTFDTLINSSLIDAEKGYWYKALLYLKTDRIKEAKHLLDNIISKSLYNHEIAKQLQSDL